MKKYSPASSPVVRYVSSRYVAVALAVGLAIVSAGGALFALSTPYVTERARFERN